MEDGNLLVIEQAMLAAMMDPNLGKDAGALVPEEIVVVRGEVVLTGVDKSFRGICPFLMWLTLRDSSCVSTPLPLLVLPSFNKSCSM
jgi:hypothetical protein